MNISLPLDGLSSSSIQPSTVTCDTFAPGTHAAPCTVKNAGNYCCVHDTHKAVLFHMESADDVLRVFGVVFFRRVGYAHVLSCLTDGHIVDFAEGSSPQTPTRSTELDVVLSNAHVIERVEVSKGAMVMGTAGGLLGRVFWSRGDSTSNTSSSSNKKGSAMRITGCFMDTRPPAATSYWWAFLMKEKLAFYVCQGGVCHFRADEHNAMQSKFIPGDVDVTDISSISSISEVGDGSLIRIIVNSHSSYDARILSVSTAGEGAVSQSTAGYAASPTDQAAAVASPQFKVETFITSICGVTLAATVHSDCVIFGAFEEKRLKGSAVIKNELSWAFQTGQWVDGYPSDSEQAKTLAVVRRDGICLMYSVSIGLNNNNNSNGSSNNRSIEEIVLTRQISCLYPHVCFIPTHGASAMVSGSSSSCILSIRGCEAFQHPSALAVGAEKQSLETGERTPLEIRNAIVERRPVLLLAIVPTQDGRSSLLSLCDSGEVFIGTCGTRGRRRVAVEEHPYDVTSCLAFEQKGAVICVLGFNDGNVKVFKNGRFRALTRMAHCGPIDHLISVPNFLDAADENEFISVCSEMGTICFHGSGEKAEVTRTFTSPSQPLTACYLDQKSEYLYAMSQRAGNLWHLPTCRIEWTFTCPPAASGVTDLFHTTAENLLMRQWTSAMRVEPSHFIGRHSYYSVCVSLQKLIQGVEDTGALSADFRSVMSLLLSCSGGNGGKEAPQPMPAPTTTLTDESAFLNLLEDLQLTVAGKQGPAMRSPALRIGAIALLSTAAQYAKKASPARDASEYLPRLHDRLLAECGENLLDMAGALLCYFCTAFDDARSVPRALKRSYYAFVSKISGNQLLSVASLFDVCSPSSNNNPPLILCDYVQQWGMTGSSPRTLCIAFLASLLAIHHKNPSLSAITERFRACAPSFVDSIVAMLALADAETSFASMDGAALKLLAVAEGYPVISSLHDVRDMVNMIFSRALEGSKHDDPHWKMLIKTLLRVCAHGVQQVVDQFFMRYFTEQPQWRSNMILFLSSFVREYPCQAKTEVSAIFDFAFKALDPKAAGKEEREAVMSAITQLVHVAVSTLPNVSFQQHLQQLAIGTRDGYIRIYCLKTAETVASFQAHAHPVLAVSYSSNTSSFDVVSVSEEMEHIRVWHSSRLGNALSAFFGGTSSSPKEFKLGNTVELPDVSAHCRGSDPILGIRFCRVKWLSPQCVEFSSPWHDKIQFTL